MREDGEISTPETDVADESPYQQRSSITPVRLGLTIGTIFTVILAGLCCWLGFRAHDARQADEFRSLVVDVARQEAVNLTSIDHQRVDADVKRILDGATGQFYDEFSARSAPFIDVVKKAASTSVGTVNEAGLESFSAREGRVLVAVSVTTTTKGVREERPRFWRIRMTVAKLNGDAKVSKVEFVQ